MNNEEYIQLPPFRKDTERAAVQMIEDMPMAEKFIVIMDILFDRNIQGQEPTGFEN